MNNKFFEWAGVITAILYSLFVALNIGIEFIGFSLLLVSAALTNENIRKRIIGSA